LIWLIVKHKYYIPTRRNDYIYTQAQIRKIFIDEYRKQQNLLFFKI
jgi:hypothetical protein